MELGGNRMLGHYRFSLQQAHPLGVICGCDGGGAKDELVSLHRSFHQLILSISFPIRGSFTFLLVIFIFCFATRKDEKEI